MLTQKQFADGLAAIRAILDSMKQTTIPVQALEPRGKLYQRGKKTVNVTAKTEPITLPVRFMTKAEINKALPSKRDQQTAGHKAFKESVTVDIMRAAAYAAVNNHTHGKSVFGTIDYAPNALKNPKTKGFFQQGVAKVIDHTASRIVVQAKWLNCHGSNVTVKTGETIEPMIFSHTYDEWRAMWPVVKKLLANPKHKSNLFRVSTAK